MSYDNYFPGTMEKIPHPEDVYDDKKEPYWLKWESKTLSSYEDAYFARQVKATPQEEEEDRKEWAALDDKGLGCFPSWNLYHTRKKWYRARQKKWARYAPLFGIDLGARDREPINYYLAAAAICAILVAIYLAVTTTNTTNTTNGCYAVAVY